MKIIDISKDYYDAYISRPYILYRDKEKAKDFFELWKKVWYQRDIVIVEGEFTRSGVGNDLFDGAKAIKRILCPAENAWNVYDEILSTVMKEALKDNLILIALGPTATVLSYDLAVQGYQAIDLGHLDNEYEWFLRNASERINLEHKYVHECGLVGRCAREIQDKKYFEQIIAYVKRDEL